MATTAEQTTLMEALACLDIDLEQELGRLQTERTHWEPEWLRSLLGSHPTPPPEQAWTFPPAASADQGRAALEPTAVVQNQEPLAVPELATTEAMDAPANPAPALVPLETTVALVPLAEPSGEPGLASLPLTDTDTLPLVDAGEDATTDEVARLLGAEPAVPLPLRPSWSERLQRVFARRQTAAAALAVSEEAVSDPWVETFSEPQPRPRVQGGLRHPVLGFALGVTVATVGTLAVLFVLNQERPRATSPLTVPAPPPESAVMSSPPASPVPNLTRKELPDWQAIPTASPQASPTASPDSGFYYVVTDYQNEQSLIAAQKVVPEAFVWQFAHGVKIQLAAFEARDQAEQFVADLKAKGMNARVYP